jgi:hypothetical protein
MSSNAPSPQINVSKIPGGAGFAGAFFAISSVVIFLIGIPMLRFFLPAAIVLGFAIMLLIHFARRKFPRKTPGTPWIPQ